MYAKNLTQKANMEHSADQSRCYGMGEIYEICATSTLDIFSTQQLAWQSIILH